MATQKFRVRGGLSSDDVIKFNSVAASGEASGKAVNNYGSAAPALGYDFFQAAVPGASTDTTFAFPKVQQFRPELRNCWQPTQILLKTLVLLQHFQ